MKTILRASVVALLTAGLFAAGTLESNAQSRDSYCRRVATNFANNQSAGSTMGGAVGGALLGAGVGALLGGGKGAGVGALVGGGVGAVGGSANGNAVWRQNYWGRYDDCMNGY